VQAAFVNGSDSSASGEEGPLQGFGPLSTMIILIHKTKAPAAL
jgi:hypothetical protein